MASRTSISVRFARRIQSAPLWVLRCLEWPFVWLLSKPRNVTPAIIVFALPRSGSTVTYQAVCHGLAVNYLSNLWHLLYQLPLLGGWASGRVAQSHCSDFKSQHGFVPGLSGPAEGLQFWRRWLDCGLVDKDCDTLSVSKRHSRAKYLQSVLVALARSGRPFATAYLGHTLVPDRVDQSFPGSVLIRLRRDPVSNALSLLKSLRASGSDWFSVKPRECENLGSASDHERVAAQVYWLNRRLDEATCSESMLVIHYEDLCENPDREISRIQQWCTENGIPVERKFELPKSFPFKQADLETDSDAMKIREALDKLQAAHGRLEEG